MAAEGGRVMIGPLTLGVTLWCVASVLGQRLTFAWAFRLALLSLLPTMLVAPVAYLGQVVFRVDGPGFTALALGAARFVSLETASPGLLALARVADVFTVWSLALLTLGLRRAWPTGSVWDAVTCAGLATVLPPAVMFALSVL